MKKLKIFEKRDERTKGDIKKKLEEFLGEDIDVLKIDEAQIEIVDFDSTELQSTIEKKEDGSYKIMYRLTERFLKVLRVFKDIIGETNFNKFLEKGLVSHEEEENRYKIRFKEED